MAGRTKGDELDLEALLPRLCYRVKGRPAHVTAKFPVVGFLGTVQFLPPLFWQFNMNNVLSLHATKVCLDRVLIRAVASGLVPN